MWVVQKSTGHRNRSCGLGLLSNFALEPAGRRSLSAAAQRERWAVEGRWIGFQPAEWISFRAAPAGGNTWHSWFF
jgi:hypothetical protein